MHGNAYWFILIILWTCRFCCCSCPYIPSYCLLMEYDDATIKAKIGAHTHNNTVTRNIQIAAHRHYINGHLYCVLLRQVTLNKLANMTFTAVSAMQHENQKSKLHSQQRSSKDNSIRVVLSQSHQISYWCLGLNKSPPYCYYNCKCI